MSLSRQQPDFFITKKIHDFLIYEGIIQFMSNIFIIVTELKNIETKM